MRHIAFFLLLFNSLFPQEIFSPPSLEIKGEKGEVRSKKTPLFNPWFTGPLITPSPTMTPPGKGSIQPYLVVGGRYASFDKRRKSQPLKSTRYFVELTSEVSFGITDFLDVSITPGGSYSWEGGKAGGGFHDLAASLGFLIASEGLYNPGIKLSIGQTFPTGKYKHLKREGLRLDSTGGGAYQTQLGLAMSKLFWRNGEHPLNVRHFLGYRVSTRVYVEGLNAYGGDFSTRGTVSPGNRFTADLGIEWSLTQRWVVAMDIAYLAQNRTPFQGKTKDSVGNGSMDNLSIAPAIEYLWSPNFGMILGSQFSVYGRNSGNFANGQFSVTYEW